MKKYFSGLCILNNCKYPITCKWNNKCMQKELGKDKRNKTKNITLKKSQSQK